MAELMVFDGTVAAGQPGTRTGGVPLVPSGFAWPSCATCEGPMQFLAQLELPDQPGRMLSIFMCANDPGLCDEWDPTSGGNRALVFRSETTGPLAPAPVPGTGVPLLGEVCGVRLVEAPDDDYDEARKIYSETQAASPRQVLGQLGGEPSWLQDDETPDCPDCGRPMTFVAHLEEGRDHRTAANYGGGLAYAFHCPDCATGAFLWQQ